MAVCRGLYEVPISAKVPPAPSLSLSGQPIANFACPGELSVPGGCQWRAVPDISAPSVAEVEAGSGISAGGVGNDVALSSPSIGYLPVSLDGVSGEPLLTWSADRVPTEGLAATIGAPSSVLQKPEAFARPGGAEPSRPVDEELLPFAPEPSAVLPKATIRSQDLGAAQFPVPPTASTDLPLAGKGAAGNVGDVVTLGSASVAAAPSQVVRAQQRLVDSASFSPAMHEGTALGLSIPVPAPSARAAVVASAREALVFAVTDKDAAATAGAFTVPRLVHLRSLVEALRDRFDGPVLHRVMASSAADVFLPIARLASAGVVLGDEFVGNDHLTEQLTSNWVTMQFSPIRGAGGAVSGMPTSGFGDLGLRQSLTATASAGFDSNPFLGQGANPEVISLRLQLAPQLARSGERDTFSLTGRLEHIEYLGQYPSLQNYGADLAASRKLTERLEIKGGLTFRSDVLATNLGNPFGDNDPGAGGPVPPTGNDVTILGQAQRRTQYGLDGSLTYNLSERDQFRWSVSGRADRFGSADLVDSNFLTQRLQYSRRLGEGITIGAAVDASLIDFTGPGLDGARTVSPQLQLDVSLTPRFTLTASVGMAVTRLEFNGLEETTTALAGDASLCRKGERSSFCLNGSRQVLPAAIGGALVQTSAGLSYSFRLSERDTVQLSGNYASASQPIATVVGDFESINASARYERQLNERMRLFVSGGVLNTAGNLPTNVTNMQGLIGITMKFGQTK
jgi:hypothetical protein